MFVVSFPDGLLRAGRVRRPVEDLRFLLLKGHRKDLAPVKMHLGGMVPLDSRIARWAPVPLRLIVGYGFMEHGFAFAATLHAIGVPAPSGGRVNVFSRTGAFLRPLSLARQPFGTITMLRSRSARSGEGTPSRTTR